MSIHEASVARMQALKPGDPVTNICAGTGNPNRHAWFVGYRVRVRKNGYGMPVTTHLAKCRDAYGRTWEAGIDVIHPGRLSTAECAELFAPVWAQTYAASSAADTEEPKA